MDIVLFFDSLIYPHDTFNAEKDRGSTSQAVRNILKASFIYAAIILTISLIYPSIEIDFISKILINSLTIYSPFLYLFSMPALCLILFIFLSFLLYISARIFNGYGNFSTQSHLLSLLSSALMLSSLIQFLPFIGKFALYLILLYSARPILILIKISHKFDSRKVVLTFLLFLILLFLAFLLVLIFLWQTGIFVFFDFKTTSDGFKNFVVDQSSISYKEDIFEFSILSKLNKSLILTELIPKGDCSQGVVDLNKNTDRIETFIILDPLNPTTEVRIYNCSKKYLPRGKFYVPLTFNYQEKIIGESTLHIEVGIIQGLSS
ncbi:MAG: hypothetical protein QXY62_01825 [Candidatus Altiarchaeota archaeon]